MSEDRARTLLRAVVDFIEKNPVQDYEVFYDDAVCDGACLMEDCRTYLEHGA